jgi:hypothetical protein
MAPLEVKRRVGRTLLLRHLADVGLEGDAPATNDATDLLEFAIEHAGWS